MVLADREHRIIHGPSNISPEVKVGIRPGIWHASTFAVGMSMISEYVFRPPEGKNIRGEFDRFLNEAREKGWSELTVMFGFAWGTYVYENDWYDEVMSPDQLAERVQRLEAANDGSISDDDLYITVIATGIKFTFCHENDIHIEGPADDCHFVSGKARFEDLGWKGYEKPMRN